MLKIEIIPIYINVNINSKSKLLNILLESIKNIAPYKYNTDY